MYFGMMTMPAQDIGSHRIEHLRNIVQRFLQQFENAQDEESKKVYDLLKENAIFLWDSNNVEIQERRGHYGGRTYTINGGWTFYCYNMNISAVEYSKKIRSDPTLVLQIYIAIQNEEMGYHNALLTPDDNINAGLYFIKDWNITINKDGQKIFFVNRSAYWKQRQLPITPELREAARRWAEQQVKDKLKGNPDGTGVIKRPYEANHGEP